MTHDLSPHLGTTLDLSDGSAEFVTHGVLKLGAEMTVDGKPSTVAFHLAPTAVTITSDVHAQVTVEDQLSLAHCSVDELKALAAWAGVDTSAKTRRGLTSALERHFGSGI